MLRPALFIFSCALCLACQAQRNSKEVQEDLASIRPKFQADSTRIAGSNGGQHNYAKVTPILTGNQKVDAVLDSIDKLNVLRKYISGYTIQISSGQSKEEANNAKKKLSEVLDLKSDLQYIQPKFRVKV